MRRCATTGSGRNGCPAGTGATAADSGRVKRELSMAARYDVIVIGAGIAGMYQLHRLRGLGLRVRVFEAGDGVGGTWYWNRYPGARFDSESWTYGYSFSDEILREGGRSGHFAAQPEALRSCTFVARQPDLRPTTGFPSPIN